MSDALEALSKKWDILAILQRCDNNDDDDDDENVDDMFVRFSVPRLSIQPLARLILRTNEKSTVQKKVKLTC